MSCQRCGTDQTNRDLCTECQQVWDLREQVTILKAERDEARARALTCLEALFETIDIAKRLSDYVPKFPSEGGPTPTDRRIAELERTFRS